MKRFDEKLLVNQLQSLSPIGRVIFAASCATRIFCSYLWFHERTGLGNPAKLQEALDHVWDWTLGIRQAQSFYEQQLSLVMNLIPEEDESWTLVHTYAEDTVSAVAYVIRTILTNDSQEAAWAARRVYDLLDNYVITTKEIDVNNPGAEREILSERLIQTELSRQERDIGELGTVTALNAGALSAHFKMRASNEQFILE